MKVWKRKKHEITEFRWALDNPRRNWIPVGYYGNRPHLLMGRSIDGVHTHMIGRNETIRFICSPGVA